MTPSLRRDWSAVSSGRTVLTRSHRLISSQILAHTVRRGRRAGTSTLVLHLAAIPRGPAAPGAPIKIGFVVNKAVGPAVTRNLVKRRLRHIARERLTSFPGSAALVVRALPASATASYTSLLADFDAALVRVVRDPPKYPANDPASDPASDGHADETAGARA